MELHQEREKHARVMDYSRRDAKLAVADVAKLIEPWHTTLALTAARATHALNRKAREELTAECDRIERAIAEARAELLVRLLDAPQKVTSDSRVVDIEKALDNVELQLRRARLSLAQNQ